MQQNTKNYPKDSVGKVINEKIPVFFQEKSVRETLDEIENNAKRYSTINYIYLVDRDYTLTGVLSIKNLLIIDEKNQDSKLKQFVPEQSLVAVHPYSHQEQAAMKAVRYNIKAIPVIDKDGKLLGVVDNDSILAILHAEKVDDLLKFAGLHKYDKNLDNFLAIPLITSLKHRLPWLLVGLIGGLSISHLIALFEESLEQSVIIAAFIPMMVYMSNAVGQQVTALLIRDSAINEKIPYFNYFLKQLISVVLIGVVISLLLMGSILILHQDLRLAIALALAMFGTVSSSIITGFVIPFIFIKLKSDPANSSGPVGTVIQDFFSVLIYFCIISVLL